MIKNYILKNEKYKTKIQKILFFPLPLWMQTAYTISDKDLIHIYNSKSIPFKWNDYLPVVVQPSFFGSHLQTFQGL